MARVNIKLSTFGGFRLQINGKDLKVFTNGLQLPWQLFVLLAIQKDRYMHDNELFEHLWGIVEPRGVGPEDIRAEDTEKWMADKRAKMNSLKNTVLRLKKELIRMTGIEAEPIYRSKAGYQLSNELAIEVDYLNFNDLCTKIYAYQDGNIEQLLAHCYALLELYQGGFDCLGDAKWMRNIRIDTSAQFCESISRCCEILWNNKMDRQILELHQKASRMHTLCDELNLFHFRALSRMGRHRALISVYHKTIKEIEERTDSDSPIITEIKELLQNSYLLATQKEQALSSIKQELSQNLQKPGGENKANACSFEQLKRVCIEYSGRCAIIVFTFRPARPDTDISEIRVAREQFLEKSIELLRGNDKIASYSQNQVVVAIPNHSFSTALQVRNRLCAAFRNEISDKLISLEDDISELQFSRDYARQTNYFYPNTY